MTVSVSDEEFFDTAAFEKLKRVLHSKTSINFGYYRESYLKRRIKVRLVATKCATYSDYVIYLAANPDEYDLLINDLTINFTKFFRDSDVYSYLESELLPELLSSRRMVRIWSAGCATGEEPYSLAMLIRQIEEQNPTDCRVTVYASDLDKNALGRAKSGEYTERMVNGIDEKLLSKYFDFDGSLDTVKPFVKQVIQFEEQDLMTTPKHRNLDLILCRNVMIYFTKEIQSIVYGHFCDSLKSDGYLITGKTEFVGFDVSSKFVDVNPKCRVYKKA
jgi:chemotaxis protein methyltransferase CheR